MKECLLENENNSKKNAEDGLLNHTEKMSCVGGTSCGVNFENLRSKLENLIAETKRNLKSESLAG